MASAQNKRVLALMRLPENSLCADCHAKDPRWASSKLGVFICINCSGIHRGLGTHITFVRSCTLDTWKPEEVDVMERVGNKKANLYWEANMPPDFVRPRTDDMEGLSKFIRQKYELKKWIDPLKRPPQIPENIPWEPEPPKTYSVQSTNSFNDNQLPNEAPRRRKKKKNIDNQNNFDDPYNNNYADEFQNRNSSNSASFTEAKNKMINNKKKFTPQNNIPLEHENGQPSSDSLMNVRQPYNSNSNIDDDGFDPFSGKPLSKELNFNPDDETDESDPTLADKVLGFIQNGIDFIIEKTKSLKKNNIPNSSGKMSENPRIPKQESIDALHPHNSNRPQFNSFEIHQQPPQIHQQPLPPPPQLPPSFSSSNQANHNEIGKRIQNQPPKPSADVFSLLSGSDVIIDDSQTDLSESSQQSQPQFVPRQPTNPFLGEMKPKGPGKGQQGQDGGGFNPFLGQAKQEGETDSIDHTGGKEGSQGSGTRDGFNPFLGQAEQEGETASIADAGGKEGSQGSGTRDGFNPFLPGHGGSGAHDLLSLDISPAQPSWGASSPSGDLLGLDLVPEPQPASRQAAPGLGSDLLGLDIEEAAPEEAHQPGPPGEVARQASPNDARARSPSAYEVFGGPGSSSGFGALQPGSGGGLGSLGLSPQQQQIAARAVLAHSQQQRMGSPAFASFSSGPAAVFRQSGSSSSSFASFAAPQAPAAPNAGPSKSNRSGPQSSNDPFFGMNPF